MKLFSFWRSLATFRVRIALNLKGLRADVVPIDLDAGEQLAPEFAAVNPQKALPALVVDDGPALFQSLAILEYLEETHPQPPLLPADARGRARVRALSLIAAADGHPLLVPRVRNYLEHELKLSVEQRQAWARHWIAQNLAAFEGHLAKDRATGKFSHGDAPTMADVCLVGQVAAAQNARCDLAQFPTVMRIADTAMAIPAFAKAHPLAQPGAPTQAAR